MTTFVTRVQTRILLAAALTATAFTAPVKAQEGNGASFMESFDQMDRSFWYVSDGWNNGAHQNCTWSKKLATVENGQLTLGFEEAKAGDRNFACGEIQTKGRYRYGTFEARMKAATGPGLNSAFFTYIGPTDKKTARRNRL